jgi:hypothetical protein
LSYAVWVTVRIHTTPRALDVALSDGRFDPGRLSAYRLAALLLVVGCGPLPRARSAAKPLILTDQKQSSPAAAQQRSYGHILYFDEEPLGFGDDDTIVEQPSRDEPFAPVDAVQCRLDI